MVDTDTKCSIVLLETSCSNSANTSPSPTLFLPATTITTAASDHPITPDILITSPKLVPRPHLHDVRLVEEETDELQISECDIEDLDLDYLDLSQKKSPSIDSVLSLSNTYDSTDSQMRYACQMIFIGLSDRVDIPVLHKRDASLRPPLTESLQTCWQAVSKGTVDWWADTVRETSSTQRRDSLACGAAEKFATFS